MKVKEFVIDPAQEQRVLLPDASELLHVRATTAKRNRPAQIKFSYIEKNTAPLKEFIFDVFKTDEEMYGPSSRIYIGSVSIVANYYHIFKRL